MWALWRRHSRRTAPSATCSRTVPFERDPVSLSRDWHIFERLADSGGDAWKLVCRLPGSISEENALKRGTARAGCDSNVIVAFKPRDVQHSRT